MTDERIIAYLLEELPEADLERFEDDCFAQKRWPTQVRLVEEELIEAYLRNELTPERRQRFERNYLNTEARKERVSRAAGLLRLIDESLAHPIRPAGVIWMERFRAFWGGETWGLRAAALIAIVTVIAGALWLFIFRPPSAPTFATLTLTISSNTRAEGPQAGKISLPPAAHALKISLTLPQGAPQASRYRVELESNDGVTKSVEVSEEDAQSVSVVIPAAQLARGQYALKLFAIKADGTEQRINGSYFFIVE